MHCMTRLVGAAGFSVPFQLAEARPMSGIDIYCAESCCSCENSPIRLQIQYLYEPYITSCGTAVVVSSHFRSPHSRTRCIKCLLERDNECTWYHYIHTWYRTPGITCNLTEHVSHADLVTDHVDYHMQIISQIM